MRHYVYKITHIESGRLYIGKANDPVDRWNKHIGLARRGSKQAIHCAMRKYGVESFKFELMLDVDSEEEAFENETRLIRELNTVLPNGFNMNEGGVGGHNPSTETRSKISHSFKGHVHSEEAIEKMRKSHTGKKVSDETREKLREKSRAAWKKKLEEGYQMSDDARSKIRDNWSRRLAAGFTSHMKGKKATEIYGEESMKNRLEAAARRRGLKCHRRKPVSDETRLKLSLAAKARHNKECKDSVVESTVLDHGKTGSETVTVCGDS